MPPENSPCHFDFIAHCNEVNACYLSWLWFHDNDMKHFLIMTTVWYSQITIQLLFMSVDNVCNLMSRFCMNISLISLTIFSIFTSFIWYIGVFYFGLLFIECSLEKSWTNSINVTHALINKVYLKIKLCVLLKSLFTDIEKRKKKTWKLKTSSKF